MSEMERRTVLKVNFSCLRVSRTIPEGVTRTSQNEVHYRYARNILNFTESNVVASGQSIVSAQGSEHFTSQEQIPPVNSERHESDDKTIILSSGDENSDKSDYDEGLFSENNNKYYHECDTDNGALSDASTIAVSVHAIKLNKDDCSSPEDIQMPEITSTGPANFVKRSPPLDVEDQLNYAAEECSTDTRRSLGKPTIIANEVYPQKVLVYRQSVIKNVDEASSEFLGFISHDETDESNLRTLRFANGNVDAANSEFLGFNSHNEADESNLRTLLFADENADAANSEFLGFSSHEINESNSRTLCFAKVEHEAGGPTLQKECFNATDESRDSLGISASLMESEDSFGSPARFPPIFPTRFSSRKLDFTALENLSSFQDLNNTVEANPIAFNFPSMVRDTSVGERPESPYNSYLRFLSNQVEPFETVVRERSVRSSVLCPLPVPKGYSQMNSLFMKLRVKNRAELKKLQARLRSIRKQLLNKEKMKLGKKRNKSSPVKSILKESAWNTPKTRSTMRGSIKPKHWIEEAELRKQQNALLEAPKNQRLTRSYTQALNSAVYPRRSRLSLKEVRIILTPLQNSSFKKNFENRRQSSDSNFDSSLVPEMNVNSCEFEEYEHLKLSDPISIKDSTDDSHSTEENTLEEARSRDSNTDSSEETIKFRRSVRINKFSEKRRSRAILRSRATLKHHPQLRKVSKKVTFSPDITLYYIKT